MGWKKWAGGQDLAMAVLRQVFDERAKLIGLSAR